MSINILGTYISTTVVASIAAGVGVVLILLILLSCWCFRRKGGERRERTTHSASVENPRPPPKGNQNVEPTQQRQQQNNPPKMAEQRRDLYRPLPPAASPVQQAQRPPSRSPINLPSQSSVGSTNSPLPTQPSRRSPTQFPLDYESSGKPNLSESESSIPPPSPAFSHVSSQTMFTYNELAMITNGFCETSLLGEGGFGFVHKGVLPNGKQVAVKSLRPNSRQGEREFAAEVETISRVHHRHLVALVGYCISGQKRLLVYEFVANKTLEFHLHGKEQPTMDWATRMKVALGAAKGLAYLHEDCQPKIIHRDIKAANILIDNNYQAKVADFGLAKLSSEEYTHITTRVMGTLGYLAPEYASSGRLTDKSDVYSFGVMLLELITGRRPVDRTEKEYNIVQWARPLLTTAIEDENVNRLVDPRLQFSYKLSEMARMVSCAAACVRKSARHRPMMSQIVRALEGNMSISDLNEGLIPGHSMIHRYDSTSEHSGSQYKGDSTRLDSNNMAPSTTEYVSSEYEGTSSEHGLYASSTSTEAQTTRELDTEEVLRERRRFHQQYRHPSS